MSTLDLPASLDLPPHLSAHKYFFVCTLTVAAWDTLVLSPRTWKLLRTPGWPALKILYHFMRLFMPAEFTVVGVAFFDTHFQRSSCEKFFLFEPICTAILLASTSAVHVIRIHAIYDKNRTILAGMGALFAAQIVVTAICCGFYRDVPLEEGQGCIAGIKHEWVGIYWVFPTLLYTASFCLALMRSVNSLQQKPLGYWRLMLRDGLNLYGATCLINIINMLFLFIMTPTGDDDPVKTIVTSMAAVLTTSMTLRIVLSVRGTLAHGGTFSTGSAQTGSSRTTHVISTRSAPAAAHTYNLDDIRSKREGEWGMGIGGGGGGGIGSGGGVEGDKGVLSLQPDVDIAKPDDDASEHHAIAGVKVTVDREIGFEYSHAR